MTDAERLKMYDDLLSAVMPPDFKDWWENSKDEWPDVAAGVIISLRKREQFAWEQLNQRLTPQPVSVTDRLPGPEDCDAWERNHPISNAWCWWWDNNESAWFRDEADTPRPPYFTHWLPFNALPLPSKEVEE